jgi:hypothetical protein
VEIILGVSHIPLLFEPNGTIGQQG